MAAVTASPSPTTEPEAVEEEFYSTWSLFLVCILLILSLWTSYYLQINRIRAVHETLVSIFAGMAVGLIIRLAPGTMIREMLVSASVEIFGQGLCGAVMLEHFWGDFQRTR
jgi:sodium/hydrogen exchanger-like protein 6/7